MVILLSKCLTKEERRSGKNEIVVSGEKRNNPSYSAGDPLAFLSKLLMLIRIKFPIVNQTKNNVVSKKEKSYPARGTEYYRPVQLIY